MQIGLILALQHIAKGRRKSISIRIYPYCVRRIMHWIYETLACVSGCGLATTAPSHHLVEHCRLQVVSENVTSPSLRCHTAWSQPWERHSAFARRLDGKPAKDRMVGNERNLRERDLRCDFSSWSLHVIKSWLGLCEMRIDTWLE